LQSGGSITIAAAGRRRQTLGCRRLSRQAGRANGKLRETYRWIRGFHTQKAAQTELNKVLRSIDEGTYVELSKKLDDQQFDIIKAPFHKRLQRGFESLDSLAAYPRSRYTYSVGHLGNHLPIASSGNTV
jgi:hypothetical protein